MYLPILTDFAICTEIKRNNNYYNKNKIVYYCFFVHNKVAINNIDPKDSKIYNSILETS